MGCKYVKEFEFGPAKTYVKGYARGGEAKPASKPAAKSCGYAKGGKPVVEKETGEKYPSRKAMVKHEREETPRMQKEEVIQRSQVKVPARKMVPVASREPMIMKKGGKAYAKGGTVKKNYADGGVAQVQPPMQPPMPPQMQSNIARPPMQGGLSALAQRQAANLAQRQAKFMRGSPMQPQVMPTQVLPTTTVQQAAGQAGMNPSYVNTSVYQPPVPVTSQGFIQGVNRDQMQPVSQQPNQYGQQVNPGMSPQTYGMDVGMTNPYASNQPMPSVADRQVMMQREMQQQAQPTTQPMPQTVTVQQAQPMAQQAQPMAMKRGGSVKPYNASPKVSPAKVGKVMGEYKSGKLHSGSAKGPVVKSRKQAVAIAMSEGRKAAKR